MHETLSETEKMSLPGAQGVSGRAVERVPGSGLYLYTSRDTIPKVLVGFLHPGSGGLPDLSCANNNENISDLTMAASGSGEDRAAVMGGGAWGQRGEGGF